MLYLESPKILLVVIINTFVNIIFYLTVTIGSTMILIELTLKIKQRKRKVRI